MKVGMIFECGPQGADKLICEYFAHALRPEVKISAITLDNKANLLRDAGKAAKQLIDDGCCCVLIIWDLRPAWPDKKSKPCRVAESDAIKTSLLTAGVAKNASVHLICIEQELESWLLANERAISAFLSTESRKYVVKKTKKPDAVAQPKAVMINHFKQARGWIYDDKVNALKVIKSTDLDLARMRNSTSFARFEQKLLDF